MADWEILSCWSHTQTLVLLIGRGAHAATPPGRQSWGSSEAAEHHEGKDPQEKYFLHIFHKCRYILYELKIFHFLTSLSWQLN